MTDASCETDFAGRLDATAAEIEAMLDRLLAAGPLPGELTRPERLLSAMRYSALSGGKRLRPCLVAETAALFDVPRERALTTGAALECVHCYSLVHDDLPAMDNDDLRRGRPTLHRAFDEATAILAGDGLLTFAFDVLALPQAHPDPAVRIRLISELARAAGLGGMAGGQMLDLAAEGRFGPGSATGEDAVRMLQAMKTGALIRFACRAGALLGEAAPAELAALDAYGVAIGQAYQIADDLLDVESNPAALGKATGKDSAAGKATLVSLLGQSGAHTRLDALIGEAGAALAPFGARADMLRRIARFVGKRHK